MKHSSVLYLLSLLFHCPCSVSFPFCLPPSLSLLIFLSSNSDCVFVLKALPAGSSGAAVMSPACVQFGLFLSSSWQHNTIGWPCSTQSLIDFLNSSCPFHNIPSLPYYRIGCYVMILKSNVAVHCVAHTAGNHLTSSHTVLNTTI